MANAIISIINVIMLTAFSITHIRLEDTLKSRWQLQRIGVYIAVSQCKHSKKQGY